MRLLKKKYIQDTLKQEILEKYKRSEHEKLGLEQKKLKLDHELNSAKIQSSCQIHDDVTLNSARRYDMRRNFTLPKFGEIEDEEIAPEDKFQCLVQSIISGSQV